MRGRGVPGAVEIPDNGIDEDCNGEDLITVGNLPPDPAEVAPLLPTTESTSLADATSFLYSGNNPIQTGVPDGTIEVKRAAVLRGKVMDSNNQPLSGVNISVKDHPEYGQTISRADGMFDMAVNGGSMLTINYIKTGYLPAQRKIENKWQEYSRISDVILIPVDNMVTTIDLGTSVSFQVARGSQNNDTEGLRQATLLFSQGTMAQMILPDGSSQALTKLNVRSTEYTVGANGHKSMPAELPPTSAYTYAVELSADEALVAGAKTVQFNKPIYFYVDNFLNFPIGIHVPTGFYDRDRGLWIPEPDGRIVKIISINNGLAELDTNGDNIADNDSTLGITNAERQQLASLYASGKSLWRVPITHFSSWDLNFPWQTVPGAEQPREQPNNKGSSLFQVGKPNLSFPPMR